MSMGDRREFLKAGSLAAASLVAPKGLAASAAATPRVLVDWVRTGIQQLGADRILFGTDYGVGGGARGDVSTSIATLEKALTPQERQTIFVDNSRALLKAKGIRI
jgi:predicted TIM-barrel fold metal-dependent hydrolase